MTQFEPTWNILSRGDSKEALEAAERTSVEYILKSRFKGGIVGHSSNQRGIFFVEAIQRRHWRTQSEPTLKSFV